MSPVLVSHERSPAFDEDHSVPDQLGELRSVTATPTIEGDVTGAALPDPVGNPLARSGRNVHTFLMRPL